MITVGDKVRLLEDVTGRVIDNPRSATAIPEGAICEVTYFSSRQHRVILEWKADFNGKIYVYDGAYFFGLFETLE